MSAVMKSGPLYLTIDDSPSMETGALTDALRARGLPALFFCRGDRLDADPRAAARAAAQGFILGNHAWSHTRFSTLSFEAGVGEIAATEGLIETAYRAAGIARPGKYFRFPHLDRGAGGWVVDYDAAGPHRETLIDLFAGGLNIHLTPPPPELVEKKAALQTWLRAEGFAPPPCFANVEMPWYRETEMARAADCVFTFSTADWMLTPRHAGQWAYKDLAGLKEKIDNDRALREPGGHIVLAHDQDGLLETVLPLLDHFVARGFSFAPLA